MERRDEEHDMKRTLTARQAGGIVDRSRDAINKWATTGGLECTQTKKGRMYSREEVVAYERRLIEEQKSRFSTGAFGDLPASIQKNILKTQQEIADSRGKSGGRFVASRGGSHIDHLTRANDKTHGGERRKREQQKRAADIQAGHDRRRKEAMERRKTTVSPSS